MTPAKKTNTVDLRRQAEATLSKRKKSPITETDALRLVHELQVHQIELEMQKDELTQAHAEAEEALRQYTELYDFAPVGYFTLTGGGTIKQANLTGATLLGTERGELLKRRFGLFVSPQYRSVFSEFLEKVFSEDVEKQTCEIELLKGKTEALWAQIEAVPDSARKTCRVVVMDITKRKQVEKTLEALNIELHLALTREKQLAQTDVLTGINNRRHLYELAEHQFNLAVRYEQPLSAIMFDIDHFKEVNDTFGHMVGDQMLQRVTQVACAELRSTDLIGRYGGEEFVVILPMTKAPQAHSLAERIRVGVEAIRLPTVKGDASVTLSIGIVEIIHGGQTRSVEDLIRYADKAMYSAKEAGRNRTEIGRPKKAISD